MAAVALALVPNGVRDTPVGRPKTEILLFTGPIHTDILLPLTPDIRAQFAWLTQQGVDVNGPFAEWLVIGWGGSAFYTTIGTYRDVSARALVKSIMGDRSVLRVDLAGRLPDDLPVRALAFSSDQNARLLQAITASFAKGTETSALDHPGHTPSDRFFPAKGRFHLLRTCNVWIADILAQSGVRFGFWTPMPFSVALAHRRFVAR